jgi:hypothetical protein
MTPQEQLKFIEEKLAICLDNMEGEDSDGFLRWEKLANAYRIIVEDMRAEQSNGLPFVEVEPTENPRGGGWIVRELGDKPSDRCDLQIIRVCEDPAYQGDLVTPMGWKRSFTFARKGHKIHVYRKGARAEKKQMIKDLKLTNHNSFASQRYDYY